MDGRLHGPVELLEDGALVLDEEKPVYADWTKVDTVDFEGKWFRTRGPLNNPPGPQRRPVIAQAGSPQAAATSRPCTPTSC